MQAGAPDLLGLVGRLLGGRYRVTRAIGAGGMGAVYEALQEDLGRRVAIKVLLPHLTFNGELVARFRREAQAAAALGHPHIVQVTDFGGVGANAFSGTNDPTFLVMELLQGRSLAYAIAEGVLPPARVARIAAQVLSALEAAHRAGIVHRDIKPDNVFLVSGSALEDFAKLLDFGVAKLQDTDAQAGNLTATGAMIGTLAYMAPEQAQGTMVDGRADLYAVGACMYHALTGRMPFEAPTAPALLNAILQQPLTPLAAVRPDVDRGLAQIVERAMSRDPRARFASAEEMRRALSPWTGGPTLPSGAPPTHGPVMITPPGQMAGVDPRGATVGVSTPGAAPKKSSALLWIGLAAGVVLLLAIGITTAVVLNQPKDPGGVWVFNAPGAKAADPPAVAATAVAPTPSPTQTTTALATAAPAITRQSGASTATATATATAAPVRDAGAPPAIDAGKPGTPSFSTKPQGNVTGAFNVATGGAYSQERIYEKLAPSKGAIAACFQASQYELSTEGGDHFNIHYSFNVTPAGKVYNFRVPNGITYHVVNLEACLRGVISAVNFGPPVDPQSTNIEVTLRFP